MTIEGPYGDFFPEREPEKQLWIAGGIGITPFLARARHLARRSRVADIRLVYCVQDEERARFLDELQIIADELAGFEVIPHLFYRQGPLDGAFLDARVPDLAEREAFICGPPGLNSLARRLLIGAGIGRGRNPYRRIRIAMKKLVYTIFIAFWTAIGTLLLVDALAPERVEARAAKGPRQQ